MAEIKITKTFVASTKEVCVEVGVLPDGKINPIRISRKETNNTVSGNLSLVSLGQLKDLRTAIDDVLVAMINDKINVGDKDAKVD